MKLNGCTLISKIYLLVFVFVNSFYTCEQVSCLQRLLSVLTLGNHLKVQTRIIDSQGHILKYGLFLFPFFSFFFLANVDFPVSCSVQVTLPACVH